MIGEPGESDMLRSCNRFVAAVLAAGVLLFQTSVAAAAQDNLVSDPPETQGGAGRLGKTVRIELPITGRTLERVRQFVRRAIKKAEEQQARLVLIFEFHVPEDQDDHGRGSEFGAAFDLADFLSSGELQGVRTVAYIPQPIQGHAVLVVLACEEIIMAGDARLGMAGIDEKVITESRQGNYREIANRRKTIPAEVA